MSNDYNAKNGVKYHYNDDESSISYQGDEAEQSLVSDHSDDDFEEEFHKKKEKRKKVFMVSLFLLLCTWLIWTVGLSQMWPVDKPKDQNLPNYIDLPDLYNDSFAVKRPTLVWVKNDPRDGIFTYTDPLTNDILLESVKDGKTEVFVKASDLKIGDGHLQVHSFDLSQDAQYLLLKTNVTSQWRHSTFSNMYIYKIADKSLRPLNNQSTIDSRPAISYATWSPTGHHLAYIIGNEIFVSDLENVTRVTFDGSATIFNGKPDWVYEEEVFAKDYALWWSPDSTHIAYLRFNETNVPEFHLQYYTSSNNSYPDDVPIKYPKAGSPNPLASLHIYSLESNSVIDITSNSTLQSNDIRQSSNYIELDDKDRLITEVLWATESHSHLLFKQTNRVQDVEITSLVTLGNADGLVEHVRTYQPDDGGWIESLQTMVYMPRNDTSVHYLDVIDDDAGYLHLALLSTQHRSPVWLTSGAWEVIPGSVVVDQQRQHVHYISTEQSSLERHLYKLDLNSFVKECITCHHRGSYYSSATFSPQLGYYVLQYDGPEIPVTTVRSVDNSTFETVLQDNTALRSLLETYTLPKTRMVSVNSGRVAMNAMEIVPPDFDAAKKYPVLFHVYGGPGSQLVSRRFELSWSTYLAGKLGYIVVTVDGRGTGFRGRKYRSGVRGRLGELEVIDQINAARHWAGLDYVDSSRIAIWGWSYGGYMTSKVIEANSGLYAAGLAVAPVTDWRFYDSIYTERYMLTPDLNPNGYTHSAVNNMTGFENTKYLLIHGTGDDNVHFQNTAVLVDKLTQANIQNYQVQFFTDNAHAIRYHNANQNVYHLLTKFLSDSFGGQEYMHVRKELDGHFSGPLPSFIFI